MRSLKLASLVALVGLAVACGGSNPEPALPSTAEGAATAPASSAPAPGATGAGPSAAAPLKTPGEAAVGDRTTCLVSGEEFVVEPTSPKAEYKGKTYYFCCAGCEKKFGKEPEKFLSKSAK